MSHWTDKLSELGACDDAVMWCRDYADLPSAWAACRHGDWMLWLIARLADGPWSNSRKLLIRIAVLCTEASLEQFSHDEWLECAVLSSLQTFIAWSEDEASKDDVLMAVTTYDSYELAKCRRAATDRKGTHVATHVSYVARSEGCADIIRANCACPSL